MNRFVIDQRDTCIAVRDTLCPTYFENKNELNSHLPDVVCFFSAVFGLEKQYIDEFHINKIDQVCNNLNKIINATT